MNYYIQGSPAKAQQIKATFEKLGYDTKEWSFTSGMYYTLGGKIVNTHIGSNEYKLILSIPGYKELPVEHEFKVGDWVVKKDGTTFYGGNYAEQVTLIEGDEYLKCIWLSSTSWVRDNDIRLWTIADAKDGDVLICSDWLFILKQFNVKGNNHKAYCHYDLTLNRFKDDTDSYMVTGSDEFHPATKEQRDMLFAKMKEAGYEWDADKKELKKIKPHYDIKNFHAGMPVLVRNSDNDDWDYVAFSHLNRYSLFKFRACGDGHKQCIPFNGDTKHLLGTSDPCDECYINW